MDLTRELMSLFAAVLMVSIVVGLTTVVVAPTHITEEQCSMPIRNHGGYATVSCWLGFGFNSTLGYPGEGPPVGLETPLEAEVWLQQVEEQKRLIEALPVVKRLDFFCDDDNQNLNKVEATLWCCWAGGRLKRVKEACERRDSSGRSRQSAGRGSGGMDERRHGSTRVLWMRASANRHWVPGTHQESKGARATG